MARTAAQQLSQWIEQTHPELFDAIYGHVQQRMAATVMRRARMRGFGDDGDFVLDPNVVNIDDVLQQTAVQPLDLTSDIAPAFSDTGDFIASQFAPPSVSIPTLNASDLQPPMSAVGPTAIVPPSTDAGSLDVQTDNSGAGFLQNLGSGIATAAESVGKFLTSPAGAQAVTGIANAYFSLQNNKVNAQIQQQVLTAQIAKASIGQAPSPITYMRASNGQLVPVYQTSPLSSVGVFPANMPPALQQAIASGEAQLVTLPDGSTGYTIPPSALSALGGSITIQDALPWIIAVGLVLLLK